MRQKYIISAAALLSALLAASCSLADGEGMDVDEFADGKSGMPTNAVYMGSKEGIALLLDDNTGGQTIVTPLLASPATEDVTVTLSFDPTALVQYNTKNGLSLNPVDPSLVTFVDKDGNEMGKGEEINVVIPAGEVSATVTVQIDPLDPEVYSFSEKYAVPIRISGASGDMPILSSPNYSIVTLDRTFKTNVLHIIRMGEAAKISMNEPMKEDVTEWTLQEQVHFSRLQRNDPYVASPNQTVINVGGGGHTMEWYTRIAYEDGIQIKRGRDGDDMWTKAPLKDHEWINLTFIFREVSKADNTGRIEVYYGTDLVKTFDETTTPSYTWKAGAPDPAVSFGGGNYGDDYIREIKMWDRALTPAEIQDKLYLPEDPEAEGLLFYYPFTRESYDEETGTFLDLTGNSTLKLPEVFDFEFVDNVVLPNTKLVIQ